MSLCKTVSILVVAFFIPIIAYSATIVVPDDYPTIQGAINAAVNGDTVLVKPGTYVENLNFMGKAITVESSEGPARTIVDGDTRGSVVIFMNGEGSDSVLQGFTLTNGTGTTGYGGGGILCLNASPIITRNIITGNQSTASGNGGGGMLVDGGSPTVSHSTFSKNTTGGYGGGMILENCSDITVTRCTFMENHCVMRGAGMFIVSTDVEIVGCRFINNDSEYRGGGIANGTSTVDLSNCIFSGNRCAHLGGGMYSFNTTLTVTNCSFHGNVADPPDYAGGAMCNYNTDAEVTNCILWENTPDEIYLYNAGTTTVSHSCIQGGYLGPANIDVDPCFVDSAINDLHIKYNSPCRDVGDNSVVTALEDFEGDPINVVTGIVEMGADEYHNHLYYTGDATPGGQIEGKIVGLPGPGSMPLSLFLGSGVLATPVNTKWGLFYLEMPWVLFTPLGEIPLDGIKRLPVTLPVSIPAPYDVPMQAMIGLYNESFTNLCVLEVR